MKTLFIIFFLGVLNLSAQSWVGDYDALLRKYVTSDGVKYKKLKEKSAQTLSAVTDAIASEKPRGSKEDHLAYYLNAYNAWMLKKAVDAYPTDSLFNNDNGVYKRNDIKVAGKVMSLDYLENSIIRKRFADARIHFALNCASEGCPPLHKKAFQGSTLNKDLDMLTAKFINSKNGVRKKGSILYISKIFEWFAIDFEKNAGSVLGFIKKHIEISGEPQISYLGYSWQLNED